MRTAFAVLAGIAVSMGASYAFNAYSEKLPAMPPLVLAGVATGAVFLPGLIAYGMVQGLSHNAVGLPK